MRTCHFFSLCVVIDTLASFPVALSADPLLVWNYGTMSVLAFVAGILFWFSVRHLDEQEDYLNAQDPGQFNAWNPEAEVTPISGTVPKA